MKAGIIIAITVIIAQLPSLCTAQPRSKMIIHFDFDKYEINSRSKKMLDSVLKLPGFLSKRIELFGHTDAIGNNPYNDRLSLNRVNATRNYLSIHGFPETNIIIDSGLGKRVPLNKNADKDQRQANRRVEIVMIDYVRPLIDKIRDTSTHIGTNIILQNLNFIGNRHELLKDSWPVMIELLNVMRKNPTLEIEIDGHVCCTGGKEGYDDDEKALILSTTRAYYVYRYLIDNGISPQRLSWKAFGNSRPLYTNEDSPEKKMQNRRVEIRIIRL